MDIQALHARFLQSTGVCTDTRAIQQGNIFFALKGPSFNGNTFAEQALEQGASCVVIDEGEASENKIKVDDVLGALQALARYHRDQFKGYVFALTGSNGKTTTKELIHAVLQTKYHTLATQGNLNNHIGVPLTLLRLTPETEVAIIEMGANHVGEIADLCTIADPDGGLITNIGKAHIGTFGGFENIIRGKSELYDHLRKKGGDVWVNQNDPVLKNMLKRFEAPMVYPGPEGYSEPELITSSPVIRYRYGKEDQVVTHLMGAYNFNNIAAALAVGKFFEVSEEEGNRVIAQYDPDNNRSQIIETAKNSLMMDAYNANPSSMMAALEYFLGLETEKTKLLILGSMFELGEDEEEEHRVIGRWVNASGIPACFVGELMKYAYEECKSAMYFQDTEDVLNYLRSNLVENHNILIKGSRSMKLEQIQELL